MEFSDLKFGEEKLDLATNMEKNNMENLILAFSYLKALYYTYAPPYFSFHLTHNAFPRQPQHLSFLPLPSKTNRANYISNKAPQLAAQRPMELWNSMFLYVKIMNWLKPLEGL